MTLDERLQRMLQTMQLLVSQEAEAQKLHEEQMARHQSQMTALPRQGTTWEQEHAKTERALRRAIDYFARERRNDRKRRQQPAAARRNVAETAGTDSVVSAALSYGKERSADNDDR
jgi:hypothetical protein